MTTIAKRIRELRKQKGWTQKDLAYKSHVSPQVVSNWEREYSTPDTDDIANLAQVFAVPADYLLLGGERSLPTIPSDEGTHVVNLAPEEMAILQEMRKHQGFQAFFHDLSLAPEDKLRKLIRMWDIIKEDIENDKDEEPDQ
ncbi:helix-turn-helix transcriptional regulator [Tumebacillus sp. ITR2]|uniref:Helix-turn-helix transcriptional regulator n=1 Tax=Tumebacillus amylolyticus TaxID=2801339 RepID=A0ABS1J7H0_9BACL|nr:helix-turn-helix transcriptional regulator [Tumebacillus amylolyticus]MBL0386223.1 helix-turn-helix transcriptional regulator [Tumebacillus amylolyticus]